VSSGKLYIQFGSGLSAPEGWISYDASPTLRLMRIPVVGMLFCRLIGIVTPFPKVTRVGDIVKGLPVKSGSVSGVYASHVLEHLALDDFRVALANAYDMLEPGGRFRLIVPDLRGRTERYLKSARDGSPDAAHSFIEDTGLGLRTRPNTMVGRIRSLFGNSAHYWMWDKPAMFRELEAVGFEDIRLCRPGDSADQTFTLAEDPERFVDKEITELAIEAVKPQ
jgi:SAM-dependent methyltransferase